MENATRRVHVRVEGGALLGLDNGDSTDYDQYHADNRQLFNGKLLAIIKPQNGKTPRITATLDESEIPIRKIELEVSDYTVTARIFPENATYTDLYWRLADAGGIDSMLGSLAVAGNSMSAAVIPKGDGDVYIRCAAKRP